MFPATANRFVNQNDLPARVALTRLTFSGNNYRLSGNGIVLSEGIANSGALNRLDLALDVEANAVFIRNSESDFRIGGALSGSGPIRIEGVPAGLAVAITRICRARSPSRSMSPRVPICNCLSTTAALR